LRKFREAETTLHCSDGTTVGVGSGVVISVEVDIELLVGEDASVSEIGMLGGSGVNVAEGGPLVAVRVILVPVGVGSSVLYQEAKEIIAAIQPPSVWSAGIARETRRRV
jgi:hypothetical protein